MLILSREPIGQILKEPFWSNETGQFVSFSFNKILIKFKLIVTQDKLSFKN